MRKCCLTSVYVPDMFAETASVSTAKDSTFLLHTNEIPGASSVIGITESPAQRVVGPAGIISRMGGSAFIRALTGSETVVSQ